MRDVGIPYTSQPPYTSWRQPVRGGARQVPLVRRWDFGRPYNLTAYSHNERTHVLFISCSLCLCCSCCLCLVYMYDVLCRNGVRSVRSRNILPNVLGNLPDS